MDPGNTMGIHTTNFSCGLARSVHVLSPLQVPPPIPIIATAILTYSQHCFAIMNNGTGGSFALVKCNCSSRLTMLMKLAMEKTDMEREVSFRIAKRGCII